MERIIVADLDNAGKGGNFSTTRSSFETQGFLPQRQRCSAEFATNCLCVFRDSSQLERPSWPGVLLNRKLLLARLRRAFLQDRPTPGGSLRFAHRGLIWSDLSRADNSSSAFLAFRSLLHIGFACSIKERKPSPHLATINKLIYAGS